MAGLDPAIPFRRALHDPKRDHRDSALARRPGDDNNYSAACFTALLMSAFTTTLMASSMRSLA